METPSSREKKLTSGMESVRGKRRKKERERASATLSGSHVCKCTLYIKHVVFTSRRNHSYYRWSIFILTAIIRQLSFRPTRLIIFLSLSVCLSVVVANRKQKKLVQTKIVADGIILGRDARTQQSAMS